MFQLNIDLQDLVTKLGLLPQEVQKAADQAAAELAPAVYAHLLEEANEKLHSRRQMFVDAVSFKQEDDKSFSVVLDKKSVWIDSGMPETDMIPILLRSPKTKTAKDGSKYLSIPFSHGPGKGPTSRTQAGNDLVSTIKTAMKANKIPYGTKEKGPDGKFLIGNLHRFDIMDKPTKTHNGPGQGKGPIGEVRQGPTGIPFLQGVQVSQKQKSGGSVSREVTTFRTVSSKMSGSGRWTHPGLEATDLMLHAFEWGQRHLDEVILPQIWSKLGL